MVRIIIDVDGDNVKVSTETKEAKVKTKAEKADSKSVSQYARVFDDSCLGWERDAQWNLVLLRQQQLYMSELLKAQGYLFLNDVYRALGMPPSKAGQIVGWVYEENNPIGDNYVDFGLSDERNRDFIDGIKLTALLDFNVDGEILSRI